MIRGDVVDPRLTLDNKEIIRRHVRAFLLQNYHQDRIREIDPAQPHDLFSVLGTVAGFRSGTAILNRNDFKEWLTANEPRLKLRVTSWIPTELADAERDSLLNDMVTDCIAEVDEAIKPGPGEAAAPVDADEAGEAEDAPEDDEEKAQTR